MYKPEDITIEFLKNRPLSKSSLSEFNKSPKHYIQYLNEKKDSSGFLLGNLVDTLVLEPELFDKRYLVYDKPDLRTKAGKMMKEAIEREALDRTLVTKTDYETALICKQSIMDHDEARKLIETKYDIQKRLRWKDSKTKLPVVGYQDFRSSAWDSDFIVDLKTSRSADPDDFNKFIAQFSYDLQVGAYLSYYERRLVYPGFIFLVVETQSPYNVSVIMCDNKFIEQAKAEFKGSLIAFKKAMEPVNDFPNHFHKGYEFRLMGSMDYFSAQLPAWKKSRYLGF